VQCGARCPLPNLYVRDMPVLGVEELTGAPFHRPSRSSLLAHKLPLSADLACLYLWKKPSVNATNSISHIPLARRPLDIRKHGPKRRTISALSHDEHYSEQYFVSGRQRFG